MYDVSGQNIVVVFDDLRIELYFVDSHNSMKDRGSTY